eukprot:8939816-Karenia_brevis.AAC.1
MASLCWIPWTTVSQTANPRRFDHADLGVSPETPWHVRRWQRHSGGRHWTSCPHEMLRSPALPLGMPRS